MATFCAHEISTFLDKDCTGSGVETVLEFGVETKVGGCQIWDSHI